MQQLVAAGNAVLGLDCIDFWRQLGGLLFHGAADNGAIEGADLVGRHQQVEQLTAGCQGWRVQHVEAVED
ncbi:hypothetical protein DNK59_10485 [Pseudomonas sp. TKO26]|nr:hypothetical protein DNK62_10485 [Pseudomonas sp. TKO30]PYY93930.1 hypothetical protein DNK59_10485 [Pseudomonas sp. TKO26]